MNEAPSLLRNDTPGTAGWIQVLARGAPGKSNRSAIGAQATLSYGGSVQARAVTAQSSFYSVDDPRMHFGLGSAALADLRLRWPSGAEETVEGLEPAPFMSSKKGRVFSVDLRE